MESLLLAKEMSLFNGVDKRTDRGLVGMPVGGDTVLTNGAQDSG